jgi:hypothetical protein
MNALYQAFLWLLANAASSTLARQVLCGRACARHGTGVFAAFGG